MRKLEAIGPDNWRDFVSTEPAAVLLIGKDDCEACGQWTDELNEFLTADGRFSEVRFGKLNLKERGLGDFKRENKWLAEVDVLPFNVVYHQGEPVKRYAGGGIDRLVNRLERVLSGEE